MKGKRRVLITILATLSVICLAVGGVFWYWDTQDLSYNPETAGSSILNEESISGQPDVSDSEPVAEASADVSSDDTSEGVHDILVDMPEFDPGKVIIPIRNGS